VDVPNDLATYVDKVAKHAYKVTDEDVEGLKAAGYCEDEIFEITVAAALGAGLRRYEAGVRAMR
jgi:alkylhydroperoxidase family enzyme